MIFQLTSSRRGWPYSYVSSRQRLRYFNSHPHEEDDTLLWGLRHFIYISTHILTKRMTTRKNTSKTGCNISTHILTKRMTGFCAVLHQPHNISTHILTKRMTIFVCIVSPALKVFQLTSSRRGWPYVAITLPTVPYFNSPPHEEDDWNLWSD